MMLSGRRELGMERVGMREAWKGMERNEERRER